MLQSKEPAQKTSFVLAAQVLSRADLDKNATRTCAGLPTPRRRPVHCSVNDRCHVNPGAIATVRYWPESETTTEKLEPGISHVDVSYVALRGPTYRENSHANHTWHPQSH